jgi:nickel/cobalt transporter (NiCoT) family protein
MKACTGVETVGFGLFDDRMHRLRAKAAGIYGLLIAANAAAWLWAWIAFVDRPALLGTAFLAYIFGLRHAFDADHIAAIDNVVRKLMQEGKAPYSVGFFFSLGHSTIVVLASLAIAASLERPSRRCSSLQSASPIFLS